MLFRKILSGLLILVMSSPAFGASDAVGSVTLSDLATVRDTKLTPGSTVYSGDAISVSDSGSIRIALTDGTQAEILSNSSVRLAKTSEGLQMMVDRGQMSFRTSGPSNIEGLLPDATVRPADPNGVAAIIQTFGSRHAVVASEKGTLLVTITHSSQAFTVHAGEAVDLTAAADDGDATTNGSKKDDNKDNGPVAAGKSTVGIGPNTLKTVLYVGAIVIATTVIVAYKLSRKEAVQSNVGNEISPTKID